MKNDGVSAYIIPSSDPHISEYLPDHYKCIEYLSGFTGSAGTLVITAQEAGLWTDGRYFVQATEQLEGSGFELMPLKSQGMPEYIQWLSGRLDPGSYMAFDGKLISAQLADLIEVQLRPLNIKLIPDKDYIDPIWHDRPALPANPAYLIDQTITGAGTGTKLERVRQVMGEVHADYHIISSLDDLAWLFNLRGTDVKCNPVALAFAVMSMNSATLFIDTAKINEKDRDRLLDEGVVIKSYQEVERAVESVAAGSVFIDPKRTCFRLYKLINPAVNVILGTNPSTNFKAIKNAVEIDNTRKTMIRDGVALTRFFKWLEENIGYTRLSELSVAEKLRSFRVEQEGFVGDSFDTIAAYRQHGALPHYKATEASNVSLQPGGLFLLDSGGQYTTGTTDVTRVVSLGKATDAERTDYTLVLRSMIEGSTARFPKGTRGYQIDAITRKSLWDHARNYGHGTGHGVGYFLNVHEGPQVFNAANIPVDIELGMITSVEPGLYRMGSYGIRIENLVLTVTDEQTDFGEFYTFETLTVALIDTALVDKTLLEEKHINWLNQYNRSVVEKLRDHLQEDELNWLIHKAKPV